MNTDFSRIQDLVDRPNESLSVELKRWIDPDRPEGQAKIVKAALAIRNHGGGYLVIGFDNDTLEPDKENLPAEVKNLFHVDKIQALISRFASEPFEVTVEFPEREGQAYPVIVIPAGVKTPVAAKSELQSNGRPLIQPDDLYVRSLSSNNTPSTTKARWKDWANIVEVCFENREADIGRFLRRHLSGLKPETVREFLSGTLRPEPTLEESLTEYLEESRARYEDERQKRGIELPEHGTWEVALFLVGDVPSLRADLNFLNLLSSNNPRLTGWPTWLDSRGFHNKEFRPYTINGCWEALIVDLDSDWSNQVDFVRLHPMGKFYLLRALEDDISGSPSMPTPLTALDFGLAVLRTAEAMAVGLAFAKAMGWESEQTTLAFAFKWTKLRGRQLVSWANPRRYISPGREAYQDEVTSFVNVPLETSPSALSEFVNQAIRPLFEIFNGFVLSKEIVEDLTRRLLERRL